MEVTIKEDEDSMTILVKKEGVLSIVIELDDIERHDFWNEITTTESFKQYIFNKLIK